MNLSKNDIKALVKKVISEQEEVEHDLSHNHPSEIEPVEAFDGGENLVQPIDHAETSGGDPVVNEPEVIDHSTGEVVKISDRSVELEESILREVISKIIKESI